MRLNAPTTHRPRGLAALVAMTVLAGVFMVSAKGAAADDAPSSIEGRASVPGATVIAERWMTPRTVELTVATPSFANPAKMEVTLPVGYDTHPTRRWPVTYHTGGTLSSQSVFREDYRGEELTKSYASIVVSPSAGWLDTTAEVAGVDAPTGGNVGYWSDWYNNGSGGPPMYETFVIDQVIPLVDANFRTLPERKYRAIYGESMGGYGALSLASRHPDVFGSASSLSGAVDSNWVPGGSAISAGTLLAASTPDAIYGPRATQEVRWRGHNPTDLALNLATLDVQLYTGNGIPSAEELTEPGAAAGCTVEGGVIRPETDSLHARLLTLGVPHTYEALNWGCHTDHMFQRQMAATFARFTQNFAQPTPTTSTFDFRAFEPHFSVFDWTVKADPARAPEFLALHDVDATSFTITGSGLTRVVTAPLFRGARTVSVVVNGVPTSEVRPDDSGRVTVPVDLGPANQIQQYTVGAKTDERTAFVKLIRH